MKIQQVEDKAFSTYGRVLKGYALSPLLKAMEHTPLPKGEVIYVPGMEELEDLPVANAFKDRAFGGRPSRWVLQRVQYLSERSRVSQKSEINVAVTDMILLVGRQQDITEDYTYDTDQIEAFLVPAGTAVEMYATTLHYAPCMTSEKGFRCVVILPKGTNTDVEIPADAKGEARLLTARNKWLIAHEDAKIEGAFCGLKGENVSV